MSNNQQNMPMGSGLLRYRSAPSSYVVSLLSSPAREGSFEEPHDDFSQLFNARASSPETQRIFSRFMNSAPDDSLQQNATSYMPPPPPRFQMNSQFVKNEARKIENSGGSLTRHTSLPAGFLANNIDSEFSCSPFMDTISETGNNKAAVGGFNHSRFSWDDFLNGLVDQESPRQDKSGKPPLPLLSHHLSLPKLSAAATDKDSVPCKIRAKRGCATHPRSIAERVRRTKISERMRKLQGLVPNMEKQTNTSDMLDFAVDYIKDLQRQVQTLSDDRAKCSCYGSDRVDR